MFDFDHSSSQETENQNQKEYYIDLIIKYYGLCWIFHALSTIVSITCKFPAYNTKIDKKSSIKKHYIPTNLADKINWDYTTASIGYCGLVFYYYVRAVLLLGKLGIQGRWIYRCWYSNHAITLHIASSLYETTCYMIANKSIVYYLHHIVVIGWCLLILISGRAHYWSCLVGFVEGTNIPLGFVLAGPFKTTSFKDTIWYKINGVILWLMYLFIRVPSILILWPLHKDLNEYGIWNNTQTQNTPIAYVFNNPTYNTIWVWYMNIVATFLWGLSCLWFIQITQGMIKALNGGFNNNINNNNNNTNNNSNYDKINQKKKKNTTTELINGTAGTAATTIAATTNNNNKGKDE